MTSRPREGFGNDPGPDHDVEQDGPDEEVDLSPAQWRWARARAEEGFAARAIARVLGVHHPKIIRAAVRGGWEVPWGRPAPSPPRADPAPPESPPTAASGAVSRPAPPSAPRDRPPGLVAPEAPRRPAPARPEAGPPQDERSARLWRCPRCQRPGYDANRREPWHTPQSCQARMDHLARVLDDRPRERAPWEMGW